MDECNVFNRVIFQAEDSLFPALLILKTYLFENDYNIKFIRLSCSVCLPASIMALLSFGPRQLRYFFLAIDNVLLVRP